MKKRTWFILLAWMTLLLGQARAENRLGAGINYWVALDDVDVESVDDNGFTYFLSFQKRGTLLGFELNLEYAPDRFGESAWAPQAYVIAGSGLYAAAGIGIVYSDSDFADDPFFALKAGLDLEILPEIFLDLSANYRFRDKAQFDDSASDIDTDTVFLGAAVRFAF